MRMVKAVMTALLILVLGASLVSVHAQRGDCPDPFAGGLLRFSTGLWPKTDFCQHSVSYEDIRSGGPPPNGIPPVGFPEQPHLNMPALPDPTIESIASASGWLQPHSPVIALSVDGDSRAYPLAILIWHEIVNDTVGDVPVAVTFCPLCNSSIVFDRRLDGETLFFGTTGNLRNSDLVMWDDLTQSWWQQFTGEAIVGSYTGTRLTMLPSQVVGFGQFAAQHPDGQVLSRETGTDRSYGRNPYTFYDTSSDPFLFEGSIDTRLPATSHVLAGLVEGQAVAYPFSALKEAVVINDTVGEQAVVAFWQPGVASALDAASIDQSRDIGTAALFKADLDGQTLVFEAAADGTIRDTTTGSTWNAFGTAISGSLEGSQLQQIIAAPHFWFAWAAFQPDTLIYGR